MLAGAGSAGQKLAGEAEQLPSGVVYLAVMGLQEIKGPGPHPAAHIAGLLFCDALLGATGCPAQAYWAHSHGTRCSVTVSALVALCWVLLVTVGWRVCL
jgi:hypothetical protein